MQEPSIFTYIIRGEIPSYKIYEDDKTFAFLDIHPVQPGHILVVPKVQVDRIEDLSNDDYTALMQTVKKLMSRVAEVFGKDFRPCLKTLGFDVSHVHVHIIPCREGKDFDNHPDMKAEPDHEALKAMADKLKM